MRQHMNNVGRTISTLGLLAGFAASLLLIVREVSLSEQRLDITRTLLARGMLDPDATNRYLTDHGRPPYVSAQQDSIGNPSTDYYRLADDLFGDRRGVWDRLAVFGPLAGFGLVTAGLVARRLVAGRAAP